MSKTRDTGFLGNVVKYDASGNVTIVSGSTTLLNISSSGLLSVPNSEVITGSLTVLGGITGAITGSATSASYAANTSLLNGSGSGEFVPTGSFNTFSSSILSYTGSVNSQLSALQTTSGSNITRLGALESASGSAITRLSALEVTSGSNITRISALETASGSAITRLSSLESKTGSYATTGSNTFDGGQYLSSSFNPTGFSTTASLYTDGGLRVTRDAYISGTLYLNNVTVYGTQSVCYITSSQLNISSNLISVNTATPSVRFGGLAVYDSGSTGLTGSILWDSENNRWIYSNPSGSTYDGGMFISGPRNSSGLGSETGTTACMLLAGQGGDHLTSSLIYHSSTATCIPNTLKVGTNTTLASGNITLGGYPSSVCFGNAQALYDNGTGGLAIGSQADIQFFTTGSARLNISSTGDACFSANVCVLNLVSRCNIRVGVNGGYAVISGPTTGAAISLGSNSATFDRNLSLGLVGGDLVFAPVLTLNAQTSNIGIGTSCPQSILQVGDFSNNNAITIAGGAACVSSLYFGDGIGACLYRGFVEYQHNGDYMRIGTSATEAIRISSTGISCFLNTICTPRLHINTPDGCGLTLQYGANSGYAGVSTDSANSLILKAYIGTEYMRIACTGVVGINDTNPTTSVGGPGLVVKGASYLQMAVKSTASSAGIEFIPSSGISWEVQANNGTGGCKFFIYDRTNNAYRLTVNNIGNVGVGTFSPASPFHVCWASSGNACPTVIIEGAVANNSNYPRLRFKGGTYPDAEEKYPDINVTNGGLGIYINSGYSAVYNNPTSLGLNNGSITLATGNAGSASVRLTIDSNGIATFGSNVCIGNDAIINTDLRLYRSGVSPALVLGNSSQLRFVDQTNSNSVALNVQSGGTFHVSGVSSAYTFNSTMGCTTSNGVITYSVGGYMQGNTATYFDFPTWNDNSQGQMFEIKAFFDHFYNFAYGTHLYKFMTSRSTSIQDLTMFNCITGNGGCWIAYKTSDTNLRVCKIAGTYGGGGAYWVQVTSRQP